MSQTAKRRGDLRELQRESEEIFLANQPPILRPFLRFWMRLWKVIYFLVSMITYVGMILGVGMTAYWSFYSFDWKRAIIGGLCTLLIIYVNKVNPK